jgi:predicted N-acetyltransferase YhbS
VDGEYLGWLYVLPDRHREGIGSKLLRASLGIASGEPWTVVLAGNKPATEPYKREGFREVDRHDRENAGYPSNGAGLILAPRTRSLRPPTHSLDLRAPCQDAPRERELLAGVVGVPHTLQPGGEAFKGPSRILTARRAER